MKRQMVKQKLKKTGQSEKSETVRPPWTESDATGHISIHCHPSSLLMLNSCKLHKKKSRWILFFCSRRHFHIGVTQLLSFFGFSSPHRQLRPPQAFDKWLILGVTDSKRPLLTFPHHRNCVLFTSFVRRAMCAAVMKRLRSSCPESHNGSLWRGFGGDQYPSDR